MIKNPGDESGYSLVEVLAAIIILSIAIIPMVTMFDSALRSAETSGDYDRARTFANQKLEQAKNASYDDLVEVFPLETAGSSFDTYLNGSPRESSSLPAGSDFPGITYKVTKQFVELDGNDIEASSKEDIGLVKVTITAIWDDNETYSTTTVVSR